ncbi:hypothetical protein [Kitasatospora sp. NPDC127116]|uniref:hypothetical protein n=1 Tax=Kitasatospora sp. NPDC127116 TaxID=3345367 RepID=UPI0036271A39
MSNTSTTWSAEGYVDTLGATEGTLYLFPNGLVGDQFTIYRRSDVSDAEMLVVADRVLAGVQRWRDGVAAAVERNRTVLDKLAAAEARIAELENSAEDGPR